MILGAVSGALPTGGRGAPERHPVKITRLPRLQKRVRPAGVIKDFLIKLEVYTHLTSVVKT